MIASNTIVGGRYRVMRPLGGGGMKLVYLAEDLRLASRECALAEMVDTFTSPETQKQAVAAFQREADMLAQLSNEHIPRLFQPLSNATMIGTQGYAPPEQYRGKVEFRSDLYALGATMHHALSGRDPALEPPFSFPSLRSLCPDTTPALCELVDQALKYDVVLRVADAAEFRQRLMAIKSGAPIAMPQRNSSASQSSRPQLR